MNKCGTIEVWFGEGIAIGFQKNLRPKERRHFCNYWIGNDLRIEHPGFEERSIRRIDVPLFLGEDAKLLAVEMTIVVRPFVLDFAGAWLDSPPKFSQDVWEFWEREKREQFGNKR